MMEMDMQSHLLKQMEELKKTWHQVPIPQSRTMLEITEWLETNVTEKYYWDSVNITGTIGKLWLESHDDAVYYNLTWDRYD